MPEVIIDGVRYVSANEQVRESPANDVLQALWESYMGSGFGPWQDSEYKLYVELTDGPDDPSSATSLQDLAVTIQEITARRTAE